MRERPILFADAMVRAILDGRKTQTRRLATRRHFSEELHARALAVGVEAALLEMPDQPHVRSPFGSPGDLLWVREAWAVGRCADGFSPAMLNAPTWLRDNGGCWYRADEQAPAHAISPRGRWRPSIHMPRWASRISLRVTSVRVERLQNITEEDARAEGIGGPFDVGYPAFRVPGDSKPRYSCATAAFEALWDSLAQPGSTWADNPWVWVVGFERVEVSR